jgi:hypothetical protein
MPLVDAGHGSDDRFEATSWQQSRYRQLTVSRFMDAVSNED